MDGPGRPHCSGLVLGLFCPIPHGSTLRYKGRTDPTIHSKVFVFALVRGGCGRGASALPLNASEARWPPVRALRFLRSEAEQWDSFGVVHSFGVSDY